MSKDWTLFISTEELCKLEYQTALAAYKCHECGNFGHIEIDCPQAVTLRSVLRKRAEASAQAIRAEERSSRVYFLVAALVIGFILGMFVMKAAMS